MKISQIINLYKNFGFDITFSSVCASSFRSAAGFKHRHILKYLKEKYNEFISDYKLKTSIQDLKHESNIIWTMWWQGDSDEILPDIVKICFESMKRNCNSHELKILTKYNYQEYVKLPEHIMKKFEAGNITITHLSDIIRMYLLSNYGGLWLDATVFVAKEIPDNIFNMKYYTVRRRENPKSRRVSNETWTDFLQGGEKQNILCRFVYDFMAKYWEEHNTLINYFLIDYSMKIASDEFLECRKLFDNVPINNQDIYELTDIMSKKYNSEFYERLTNDTIFFKLSWRNKCKKSVLGYETFYGHLAKI